MSTRNIPQLPQIRGSLKATAGHVRDRTRALASDLSQLAQDEEDVRIGAAAVLQSIQDERAPLEEEREQLIGILEATRRTPEPAPATTPSAPPEEAVPATPPAEPPAPPEAPAQVDEPEPPVETVVLESPAPEPQGTEELGLGREEEVSRTTRHRFDPRGWSGWQWLLAILLGLIGLFIGLRTVNWLVSDWSVGWPEWIIVILQAVFGFIWVIAFTGLGFFGGALLGFLVPRWYHDRQNRRDNGNTPPPAPPAAPPAA